MYILCFKKMSLGTIANGWTICKTQAREHTRSRIVSTKDAKDDERRRLKGNYSATSHQVFRVACGGVYTLYTYTEAEEDAVEEQR